VPHGWAAGWLIAYGTIAVAVATVAMLRPGATLWRGRAFLAFNALFVGVAAGSTLAVARVLPPALAAAGGALLLGSWALKSRWLVVGGDDASVRVAIEACARRVCARCEQIEGGYRVPLPGCELRVRVRHVGARSTLLTFYTPPRHRKAELLQSLLAKQYDGALPKVRIPMR
jgi:hypothetical protein